MRGAANLGKLIFSTMFPMQPCKRLLPGETDRARDVPSPRFAHDALVVHLVEVPIELGDDLIAAQLPFAALLGGVSDRYRSLHGLIVGDQRGLSAAYGRLAGRLAPAIAPRKR
jgi:hypothetical protein